MFRNDGRVEFAIIFGSQARGASGPKSDLDIAIRLLGDEGQQSLDLRLELLAELSRLGKEVDLVFVEDAPPALAYRIAAEGRVLFTRSERAVTRFKARAYGMYPDWKRLIEPHRKAMLSRIEEGTYGG